MILTSLEIDPKELEARTGWAIKPEGACKGDLCVPLPEGAANGGPVDARMLAERIGMPLVHDEATDTWALGPEAMGRALTTAQAPDLELPDVNGNPFRLSSLRGQKVVLAAWASW
jgi:hypothetical protein